ncbi:MAG: 6-hydroxymethylpterin diphosphokinase MptE-like protein, partial [Campylobacterota bacterium]|nr:6-hydroxymethylpterin diphosphokinase MptE-like protein [Campylobacterota bacterium]
MVEELKRSYKNNLEIFKKYLPNIYKVLEQYSNKNYELSINKNDINVLKDGKDIYPANTKEYFNNLVNSYEIRGNKNILEYQMKFLKEDTSRKIFGIDILHFKYLTKMKENYKNTFNHLPFEKKEELNQDFIYTGIIYGIGLGYHIMPLINRYNFRNLILADIDIEMLRVSLYTLNWIEILQYFADDNTKSLFISVQLPDNQNVVKDVIFYDLYNNHPLSYYNLGEFISYADENINRLVYQLRYDINNRLNGIKRGFFDDEKWGLQHTIHNIKENIPILTNNSIQVDKDKFVFVIGNGPSLDNYIKIIKKYRDNAIVIASGTAINSLYSYGVVPDIYVAIERTIGMFSDVTENLPKEYTDKIIFIGMNTLHPRLFAQFKKKFMFLKAHDTGTNFINNSKYKILNYSNPTVTNGVLSLTIALGFKNICLFGMDFGYKDRKNHHSKNSIYLDKSHKYSKLEFKDEIEVEGVD